MDKDEILKWLDVLEKKYPTLALIKNDDMIWVEDLTKAVKLFIK